MKPPAANADSWSTSAKVTFGVAIFVLVAVIGAALFFALGPDADEDAAGGSPSPSASSTQSSAPTQASAKAQKLYRAFADSGFNLPSAEAAGLVGEEVCGWLAEGDTLAEAERRLAKVDVQLTESDAEVIAGVVVRVYCPR